MRYIFILLLGFQILIPLAHAENILVRNPRALPFQLVGASSVEIIDLGESTYWLIHLPTSAPPSQLSALKRAFSADFAVKDSPIEFAQRVSQASTLPWHMQDLKYDQIKDKSLGQGVVVAVIDTGVEISHPALQRKIWVNTKEIPSNGRDDDNNGFIDDVHGYDFAENTANIKDSLGHGTHTAGLIAADPDRVTGAQGIAPLAKIMVLKISHPENNKNLLSSAIKAIKYAIDNGAQVICNNWRVYQDWSTVPGEATISVLRDALAYSHGKGTIFVTVAGNESTDVPATHATRPIYPIGFKRFSSMIGVAASAQDQSLASFSNYGAPNVTVAAPGVSIMSTSIGGTWKFESGTSVATPIVAGLVARGLSKGFSRQQAVKKLIQSCTPSPTIGNKVLCGGIINPSSYLDE